MKHSNTSTPPKMPTTTIVLSKEARCHCGHLVAKLRREGVELKCRRCKRIMILPFQAGDQDEHIIGPCHRS